MNLLLSLHHLTNYAGEIPFIDDTELMTRSKVMKVYDGFTDFIAGVIKSIAGLILTSHDAIAHHFGNNIAQNWNDYNYKGTVK